MYENLVRHILSLPDEQLARCYLEDIALCAAWFDSHRESPDVLAPFSEFRSALDRWVNSAKPRQDETEGARMQPLLRRLITEIIQGRLDNLTRDQLDVIYFAWGLIERTGREDLYERPMTALKPYIPRVRAAREDLPAAPGLPNVAAKHTIAFTGDFKNCSARDVKNFAGIDMPFRGPMLLCKGDIKIVGDVPDFAAAVAEGGSCYIDGLLHGFCAASNAINVYDNISGVAIARRGAVRAAHILNRAVIISKEDKVACVAGEGPALVFGGRDISVRKSISGGTWMTREFTARGDVVGAEVHVSRKLSARAYRNNEARHTSIVLRRSLACQDYGEVLTQDATKSISAAMKLRQQAAHFTRLGELTRQEADDFAGSALLFLLGEDNTRERIESLQSRRRRASFLERLCVGVQAMIGAIEDRLSFSPSSDSDAFAVASANDSARGLLEDLERELNTVEREGPVDRDCYIEKEEVVSLGRNLSRRAITEKRLYEILHELLRKEEKFTAESKELREEIREGERALEHAIGRTAIIEKAREECARVEIMEQLIRAGKSKGGQDRVRRRVSDRFVKLVQRNIASRLAHTTEYRQNLEQCETRIRAIRDRLWDEYLVSLPVHVIEEGLYDGARAEGIFEEGVFICGWKHLLEESTPGDTGVVHTPESDGQPAAYQRTSVGAIEPC